MIEAWSDKFWLITDLIGLDYMLYILMSVVPITTAIMLGWTATSGLIIAGWVLVAVVAWWYADDFGYDQNPATCTFAVGCAGVVESLICLGALYAS